LFTGCREKKSRQLRTQLLEVVSLNSRLSKLIILAISLLLIQFYGALSPCGCADSNSDDWPMFHHDLAHTGYSTSAAITTPVVLWTAQKGYGGSPVIADGYVYILDLAHLYCINASDGHQVWNQSLPSGLPNSSPAVYGGYVYTSLTAYNAYTGEIVLNYTDYQGYTSPTVAEGMIYFGSVFRGGVFALDAATGSKIWNYITGGEVTSSPAVAYGRVYFESGDGNIYALDALSGSKIWNYKMNEPSRYMDSSPAIVDEHVYVGGRDDIYCFDALTGDKIWNYSIPGVRSSGSSPAVANGHVYVGSIGGNVYAFNASTGAQIWNATGGSSSSPAVAGGAVYLGDSYGILALNASTGTKIWNYTFPSVEYYMLSSPAIVDGVVYAGNGLSLYAFGTPTVTPSPLPSQEPFPTTWVAAAAFVVVMISAGLFFAYKIRRKGAENSPRNMSPHNPN
jgi:outer membrane protein assembly factor BamB